MRSNPDRRARRRVPVVASATVVVGGRPVGVLPIEDLSLGGAQLVGEGPSDLPGKVQLLLRLPADRLPVPAEIMWRSLSPSGFLRYGVGFRGMSERQRRGVHDAVHRARSLSRPRSCVVLVVDGCRSRRCAMARTLRALGFAALQAATPLEAISRLVDQRRPVHAVIVAPTLTTAQGCEFASFLADNFPDTRRMLICGDEPRKPRVEGELAAVVHEIVRPCWTTSSLAEALRRTCSVLP